MKFRLSDKLFWAGTPKSIKIKEVRRRWDRSIFGPASSVLSMLFLISCQAILNPSSAKTSERLPAIAPPNAQPPISASSLYFCNANSNLWLDSNNWFLDEGCITPSNPAGRVPNETDAVYVLEDQILENVPNVTLSSLKIDSSQILSTHTANILISENGSLEMIEGEWGGSTSTDSNATFRGTSKNYGSVFHASFYDTSINENIIEGNAHFFDDSTNNLSGVVKGNAVFSGTSSHVGVIEGSSIFNENSNIAGGTLEGTITLNDSANVMPAFYIDFLSPVTFNAQSGFDFSTFHYEEGAIEFAEDVTFNGNAYTYFQGIFHADVTFTQAATITIKDQGSSQNIPTVWLSETRDWNGTLQWIFQGNSIVGDANAHFLDQIYIQGNVHYQDWTTTYAYVTGDAVFDIDTTDFGAVIGTCTKANGGFCAMPP